MTQGPPAAPNPRVDSCGASTVPIGPMLPPSLTAWGLDAAWAAAYAETGVPLSLAARVLGEHRGWYQLGSAQGTGLATIAGQLRNGIARDQLRRPAVGDWVAMRPADPQSAPWPRQVEAVLPRRTQITRRTAGRTLRQQILVTNVDSALIVMPRGESFSPRRLERFVAIVTDGGVQPVVVLSKADLTAAADPSIALAQAAVGTAPVHAVSVRTGAGMSALAAYLGPGATLVLLGTSGAGKTTLLNHWLGDARYATGAVQANGRGRHTTRSRQMTALGSGALVVDTPGLREVGLHQADEGVVAAFADIEAMAGHCRFRNCSHAHEPGCAVRAAVTGGTLAAGRLASYLRLRAECAPPRR